MTRPNWRTQKINNLFLAFLQLKDIEEVASFCRDLMTEAEIQEFASRWEAAKLLEKGLSQRAISADTGTSIATVTRVNQWLKRGMGGYQLVIKRMNGHAVHRGS